MGTRPNLFQFATSELSQDAFICWLISWTKHPEEQALHQCAKSFIAFLYNLKHGEGSATSEDVSELITLKKQYQKIDVYFQAIIKHKRISFIIEDKVFTSHHSKQLERYLKVVKDDSIEEDEIIAIYFKTGYLYEWDYQVEKVDEYTKERYYILSYQNLFPFLRSHSVPNPLYQDYCRYIEESFYTFYPAILQELYKDGKTACFKHDFAQYDFMKRLAYDCPNSMARHVVYNGYNPDGRPFTQFKFIHFEDGIEKGCHEAVFYRLDQRNHGQYYLSIRQHAFVKGSNSKVKNQKEAQEKKLERLKIYRCLFNAIDQTESNLVFSQIQNDYSGHNESEIAVLFFNEKENSPRSVLEEMPRIHQAFVEGIRDNLRLLNKT